MCVAGAGRRHHAEAMTNHVILTRVVHSSASVGRTPDERMDCGDGEGKDLIAFS